ncbi:uncharacterized protein LOC119670737 [Teleopsis dalmanni]|uniref:uncharacterized protein LOC119670737 n=1 Tax=Teleopsis dalmanni TaxID=139649 RepID=UPI0018CCF83A|nr:uncharacterized protein LOC119670737 [Teleopsis dalmanni]
MSPAQHVVDDENETLDLHVAASTSNQKMNYADLEAKWRDVPDKYFIIIAHFLAGHINDTDAMDRFNGPILKASIKSVYWIFIIQYAILAMLGIIMNGAIIAYVLYHRLFKDVTHAFIINLALCHFVQCAIVLPITLMVLLIQNWIFGQFLCFFLPMLQDIPLHVAIISHILIAWDRMRWLGDPLKGRLPAFVCCCATWLTGMVIALPYPIYTFYVEIGDYVPRLNGIGLCVVNLMDDMHEYTRGLFLSMYCAPTVLLAYLYIRTSQELRPPDGPFAVMMFEHRADLRNRQRNSSASSVDRGYGGSNSIATTATASGLTALTTNTGSGGHTGSGSKSTRSYDLYSAELDVSRERRNQRNFGSMAATQIVCLCPLMVLRLARLSMEETYENQKHFDFTYLMFVWIAFLPTVIFPCIYASQILPRTEQERLRGYFRLSSKRKQTSRKNIGRSGGNNEHSSSSRENSIEKDENTNTTLATSIISNGEGYITGVCAGDATAVRHELKSSKQQHHGNYNAPPYRQGKDMLSAGMVGNKAKTHNNDGRLKKNDVKINIISDGKSKAGSSNSSNITMQQQVKNGSFRSSRKNSAGDSSCGVNSSLSVHRKYTIDSLDNNSCSNMTSSTYCNGNSSLVDDGGISNFGDGEDSSIVSGMIVHNNGNGGTSYYDKKWSHSGQSLRHKDVSFSDTSSFTRMDSSSTLERDLEIMDLLERERSMDIQEMIEREKLQEEAQRSGSERRRLPDIEKIYQRSPKAKIEPYNYEHSTATASTISARDTHVMSTTVSLLPGSDPLQANSEAYSIATTLNEDDLKHVLPHDNENIDDEVPADFFDKYTPGGVVTLPSSVPPITPTAPYQYQYNRRLSRKSSHHSQGSNSHRNSKRDSFNSLNGSDLIAGAFGELDPTQPLTKMSVIENRMRRSSGRTSSFSSSARSSMKSRDYNHGSTHSAHPELDFRENIFAEL